ncbi:MAG: HNH endonuclease, partial [Spirochaetaceae bacterium]|nr:HNH endonuclease [Spirochaetaceae bacterium]
DGGRCRYRDPLTGRRCNSSHLLQIHHLLPVAEGGGPEPENLALACLAHHRMCHGYGPAPTPEPWT